MLLSASAFASLERIAAQNLDLSYVYPSGKGQFEKLQIGVSLVENTFPIEVERREDSFDILTPFVDFSWLRPVKFVHDLEALEATKLTARMGYDTEHTVSSEYLMLRPAERGEYKAYGLDGKCSGEGEGRFEDRLLAACLNHLDVNIKKIDFSSDFILYKVMEEVFPGLAQTDFTGEHVRLKVDQGKYSLQVYLKYGIRAGLRAYGMMEFQDEGKVFAIRIDQVRFGYMPITNIVMKKLKEVIKSPSIEVAPPWIRIKLEE